MNCAGTPAERYALSYVLSELPEFEAERFEEHYFDCPVCLADVQAIQAMDSALRRRRVAIPAGKTLLRWPLRAAVAGAAAAMLLTGVVAYRLTIVHPTPPAVAQHTEPPSPRPVPSPLVPAPQPAQLADLTLPAFVNSSLRGESAETHFAAGMRAYSGGNCRAASASLARVPDAAAESRAARFYLGVCEMKFGQRKAAEASLRQVAAAGDSPQQEAALYYLAQISLLDNDPARAHRYLTQTIALRGDLLAQARAEDRKVMQLTAKEDRPALP